MPIAAHELEQRVKAAFPDAEIALKDTAGDADHYDLTITSAAFRGKSRVEQHRMVYSALGDIVGTTLHALAVTTRTPS